MEPGSASPPVTNESLRHRTLPLRLKKKKNIKLYIFLTNPTTKSPSILKRFDCLGRY